MPKPLTASSALLWGLQFAFLNPVLALLLVALYDATPSDVGWVLAVYNAGGFAASLLIPGWADRTRSYVLPMLGCAVLTLLLAIALMLTTALPLAVVALIVLGGPAGVGSTLLFAELRHSGASTADVMNTRAIVSFAWVAGPPLATLIMGVLGNRSILVVLAAVGALNIVTTVLMLRRRRATTADPAPAGAHPGDRTPVRMPALVAIVAAFVLLQATNAASVSVMSLFVTAQLGLPVIWAGVALGVAALLEIPALWVIGRIGERFSAPVLIISGCVTGALYYALMAVLRDPVSLLAVQALNAWSFGIVAGIGMTLFQQLIPRPGLATGLFMNTRRIGAIVSGGIIALAAIPAFGYPGVFLACAILTLLALAVIEVARRLDRRPSIRDVRA